MRRPRWELRGSPGAFWAAFVAANGRDVIGNSQQRYTRRRDALHSIEVVTGHKITHVNGAMLLIHGPSSTIEVRDTTKGASDADRG